MGRKRHSFESYVERTDSCYLWNGAVNSSGYGSYRFEGKPRKAHHVAYILAYGALPTSGGGRQDFVVMHTCDNRLCVNPLHLKLGTQGENVRDAIAKGRVPHIVGPVRMARRKCNPAEVISYRRQGVCVRDIATFYGCALNSVYRAIERSGRDAS